MSAEPAPVLVTGATGRQGGATARALLASGVPVRALVRDPSTERAKAVGALGAELVTGDLHDRDSIERAAKGAGVRQFVHTSVTGAGQHTSTPGWAEGRWAAVAPSMDAKAAIQDRVRAAGFDHWTILKPGFFMANFLPSMAFLFPRGIEGGLVSVLKPRTRLALVATEDIGAAAAMAVADPERFDRVELEFASDHLSMAEIAEVLSRVLGTPLSAPEMTVAQAVAAGMPGMGAGHDWMNAAEQPGRPRYARDLGIPLTDFETWAREHVRADA